MDEVICKQAASGVQRSSRNKPYQHCSGKLLAKCDSCHSSRSSTDSLAEAGIKGALRMLPHFGGLVKRQGPNELGRWKTAVAVTTKAAPSYYAEPVRPRRCIDKRNAWMRMSVRMRGRHSTTAMAVELTTYIQTDDVPIV